eukprot:674789_1
MIRYAILGDSIQICLQIHLTQPPFFNPASEQNWDTNAQLCIFDLDELALQSRIIIPKKYYYPDFAFDSCIATNHTHLFLVNQGIIMYDISAQTYTESRVAAEEFDLVMSGCAVTIDNDVMFIFGGLTFDGITLTE